MAISLDLGRLVPTSSFFRGDTLDTPSPRPIEESTARAGAQLDRLMRILDRLRAPDGCPWDRAQTLESLRPYLIEECYEVLDAIDAGNRSEHREELGDLLFQIVFQAQLAREAGEWDLADVIQAIAEKLEYRHPDHFGGSEESSPAGDAAAVEQRWVLLKAKEKERKRGGRVSVIDGVPSGAPALLRAERITEKASRIGFDWPDVAGVRGKIAEELAELDEALGSKDAQAIEHELGDLLFTVANLARHVGVPAEDALRGAIRRFDRRFRWMEGRLHERGLPTGATAAPDELESLWEEAKARDEGAGPA